MITQTLQIIYKELIYLAAEKAEKDFNELLSIAGDILEEQGSWEHALCRVKWKIDDVFNSYSSKYCRLDFKLEGRNRSIVIPKYPEQLFWTQNDRPFLFIESYGATPIDGGLAIFVNPVKNMWGGGSYEEVDPKIWFRFPKNP